MNSPPAGRRPGRALRERLAGTPRLVLAVVLLVAGTLVALTATAPPPSRAAVVVVRAVAAGAVVGRADLAVSRRPAADLPAGALADTAAVTGRRAVAALAPGEVVTAARLAPTGFSAGLGQGRAVATVTVPAARAGVVAAGDTVRLVTAAASGSDPFGEATPDRDAAPVTVADRARVLAVWPAAAGDDAATLVVDVDVGSASRLAVLPADLLVGFVVLTA